MATIKIELDTNDADEVTSLVDIIDAVLQFAPYQSIITSATDES